MQPNSPICDAVLAALCDLARHARVHVKLSGFWALGGGQPHFDLLPQMESLREAFGVDRLIWASDDPYQRWRSDYVAGKELVSGQFARTDDEAARFLLRNSERLYF